MDYLVAKWLHVLSSTLLFGAGVGSAFHLLLASLSGRTVAAALVARQVVWADWLFTATTVVFQPLSGWYLLQVLQLPWSTPWVRDATLLYALAVACWLPVAVLQMRMRRLAEAASAAAAPLPAAYRRCLLAWVALGVPAFTAFVAVFWLMVAKPA